MTDRPDDSTTDTPTGQRQDTVSVGEAARRLGLSPDAVRGRIRRGTLEAEKRDGAWYVTMPAEDTDSPETVHDSPPVGEPVATAVDLSPLVSLVDDLTRRNADLSAAAALWQARAAQLEDQLKQLTAGTIEPQEAPESPQSVETPQHRESVEGDRQPGSASMWQRLGRWLRGE